MKIALISILALNLLFKPSTARAEFSTALIGAGIAIGLTIAEISHGDDNECDDIKDGKSEY